MSLDDILRSSVSRLGVVRVRNALNSWLWALGLLVVGCLGSGLGIGPDAFLTYVFAGLTTLVVLLLAGAYFYFMIRDPDRLQSEEYRLAERRLTMIERKGTGPADIEEVIKIERPTEELDARPQGSEKENEP
jgi:hypothetical protein